MECHHCRTEMTETEVITEGRTRQSRYLCPVCRHEQLVSVPIDRHTILPGGQRLHSGCPTRRYGMRQL